MTRGVGDVCCVQASGVQHLFIAEIQVSKELRHRIRETEKYVSAINRLFFGQHLNRIGRGVHGDRPIEAINHPDQADL